jgi:hypothetical protein
MDEPATQIILLRGPIFCKWLLRPENHLFQTLPLLTLFAVPDDVQVVLACVEALIELLERHSDGLGRFGFCKVLVCIYHEIHYLFNVHGDILYRRGMKSQIELSRLISKSR